MATDEGAWGASNYSELLGIMSQATSPRRVVCRLLVSQELANRNGVLHGGALMSLVDHAAGTLAFLHCPKGMSNVTVEAKTNFVRSARIGDVITAIAEPAHVGRSIVVVQVGCTREDAKQISITMQTHMLIEWKEELSGLAAAPPAV